MRRFTAAHALMIAPVQALLALVIFFPALWVLGLSFTESSYGQAPRFVGFANYAKLLTDGYFWQALLNTVIVVNIVVYAELVIGLGMALLFAGGVPMRRLMISVVLAPYAISEVSAVVMWKTMLDPEVGVVSKALAAIGLPALEWAVSSTAGLTVVSLLSIWLHLPFTFIILYAARLAVPGDLYEAAKMDGAGVMQRLRYITVPTMMPAILVAVLFRYIFAFRLFSEVWLLTGGGPARSSEVVAVFLYLEAFRYNEFGVAAATGWLMVLASVLLGSVYLHRLYKRMFAGEV